MDGKSGYGQSSRTVLLHFALSVEQLASLTVLSLHHPSGVEPVPIAFHLVLIGALAGSPVPASARGLRLRVVATSSAGSVWRLAEMSVERAGSTATAWFFVDNRRAHAATSATSRIRYRFGCRTGRAQRLERVDLAANGRVLARTGPDTEGPAGRGTFAGRLLEAACGAG